MNVKFKMLKYSDYRVKRKDGTFKKYTGKKYFVINLTDGKKRKPIPLKDVPFNLEQWDYKKQKLLTVSPKFFEDDQKTERWAEKVQSYKSNLKWIDEKVAQYADRIDEFIRNGRKPTFDLVIGNIIKEQKDEVPETVFAFYEYWIKQLKAAEKFGNAKAYKSAYAKFKAFWKEKNPKAKDLPFYELTLPLILDYKQSMIDQGLSDTTISMYLRNLSAIYNKAIKKAKNVNRADFPFESDEIMEDIDPVGKPRALTLDEVNELRRFRLKQKKGSEKWHACNFFLAGYLGMGINFQDMARLEWANYINGNIHFVRKKTKGKKKKEIIFEATKELPEIIAWYGKNNRQIGNPFIFPVLNGSHDTEAKKFNRIMKVRTQLNKTLRGIGKELNFSVDPLTTYVWRHTFATVARNELDAPIEMVQQALGHKDKETTMAYLAKFPSQDMAKTFANL